MKRVVYWNTIKPSRLSRFEMLSYQQIQQQNQLEVELKIVEQRTLETRGRVGIVEHATAELNGRLNKESKDYLKNFEELRADEKKLTI